MQVFHGSYTEIETVDLSKCQANKDFGKGFYVTKFRKQAEEWAEIIGDVNHTAGIVTEFTFYERAFTEENLKTLRFNEYNDEWFDFVILNRNLEKPEPSHQICFCTVNSLRMLKKTNNEAIIEIEDISELIVEKLVNDFGFDEETATDRFFSSDTFSKLTDTETNLYQRDWTEIYELLKQELND